LSLVGGVRPEGLYGKVKVRRKAKSGKNYENIEIDIEGILNNSKSEDILLQPDDVLIVERNRTLIVEGEVNKLLNANLVKVTVEVANLEQAMKVLENTSWYKSIDSIAENKLSINLEPKDIPALNKYLVENGVMVNALIPVRSLEDYFLSITSGAK